MEALFVDLPRNEPSDIYSSLSLVDLIIALFFSLS